MQRQRAKKVVSDSPGLVDFAIRLVNCVFNLPDGQVTFLEESEWQKNCEINSASQKFLGLVEMMSGLVNASFSLPKWQAVRMIIFAPWTRSFVFVLKSCLYEWGALIGQHFCQAVFVIKWLHPSPVESLKAIHHFRIDHNAPCLSPKSLHNHCFQLLLSITVVPWEIEDNEFHCRKWWIVRNSCELRLSVTLSPVFFSLSFKASILASCSLTVYCSWPSRSRSSPTCLSSSCTVWCWIPLRTTARIKELTELKRV